METWYEIEYTYKRPGSEKIMYKGLKVFRTKEEAEKFVAVVYWLSQKNNGEYDSRQLEVSKEYLGKRKLVSLNKIYRCTKKEIELKVDK